MSLFRKLVGVFQAAGVALRKRILGGAVVVYVEDVFSTFLYTGNGGTQTITNDIDLSTKGGLVWAKARSSAIRNSLFDTLRGAHYQLVTDDDTASTNAFIGSTAVSFNSNGFTTGSFLNTNTNNADYVSWTFRKQPKFFDVVTYTGNGSGNRIITSSLGSPIGCVFIKRTDSTSNWATAHRKDGSAVATGLNLNTTAAALYPNSTNDTFDATGGFNAGYIVDSTGNSFNVNGASYVAYLFAHNAGGFGLTGTDNVISCGSFSTDGAGSFSVNLGYEPQWLMIKSTNNTGVSAIRQNWLIYDTMRGLVSQPDSVGGSARLFPNSINAESSSNELGVTATGFNSVGNQNPSTGPYIYIAIRRGPMKVPTSGTSVFSPIAANNPINTKNTTNFPIDLQIWKYRNVDGTNPIVSDRLRGISTTSTSSGQFLRTSSTFPESSGSNTRGWDNTGFLTPLAYADTSTILWNFGRAPGFFDVVCYTGVNSGGQTLSLNHSLGVTPELILIKNLTGTYDWLVYSAATGTSNTLYLNLTNGSTAYTTVTSPTTSSFIVNGVANTDTNEYVAYLFATCPGVSKVGSYEGSASAVQVDCGFTNGARFVLVKHTTGSGGWIVWDSTRGIISGNDPFIQLNNTNVESTADDYIDPYSAGFEIAAAAPGVLNGVNATFIFLAIA